MKSPLSVIIFLSLILALFIIYLKAMNMKPILKTSFLILIFLLFFVSCREVSYSKSEVIIVSKTTDLSLNESALIYGMVYYAADEKMPYQDANIWIDGSAIKTVSDNSGSFSLKLNPGTYTIKCLGRGANQEFLMTIKDLSVLSNEKVQIKFLHGEKAE